jgi:3-deoxy-D-manno-octulosonate 8-phosphate phosphatase (KDO 8-P phosphatase)
MKKITSKELLRRAAGVRLLIVDVDGVLTDGRIILDNNGNEFKAFHVRDGHGLKMVQRVGIGVAIITGRQSKVVERRAKELGITEVHQRCRNKVEAHTKVNKKFGVADEEVAYVGDDIVDIPLLVRVGLPVAVADADESAKNYALMVTKNAGGRGAVREVTDLLLKAGGKWDEIIKKYAQT